MAPDPERLFLSAARAEALAAFRSPDPDVLSLHLPVDPSGNYVGAMKHLLHEGETQEPRLKDAAAKDVERAVKFVTEEFVPGPHRSLAVYSCHRRGLFEAFPLPQPARGSVALETCLDLKPLRAIRGQYNRYGAVLLGRGKARFVEIFLGQAVEVGAMDEDYGSVEGLGRITARVATLARERRFDRLILGAQPGDEARLAPLLDPGLQKDLIVEPLLGPERPLEAVLERVLHNEREARRVKENILVHRLLDETRTGQAVIGLEAVSSALQQGCVSRVLVRDGYAKMGRACPECGHLSVDHKTCPWCFKATETVLDLVAELIDRAMAAGCEVFRVMHDQRFDGICRIGAELRTTVQPHPEVPSSRALRARFKLKDGQPSPLRRAD